MALSLALKRAEVALPPSAAPGPRPPESFTIGTQGERVRRLEKLAAEGIATVDYAAAPRITMSRSNIESRPSTIYSDPFGDSRRQSLS